MSDPKAIVVAGAGAVGCYVGGRLLEAGHNVTFLGRNAHGDEIARNGLKVSGVDAPPTILLDINWQSDPACLAKAEIVLVAVKSRSTLEMAEQIARYAPRATVISLQNGISNPDMLRAACPEADVRAAIVEFNVIHAGEGQFRKATSGDIEIEDGPGGIDRFLSVPGSRFAATRDIRAAQWGKLLVNLNNALNALSGLPLREQLADRRWRRLLAAQIDETREVLTIAGIRPKRFTPLPTRLVPSVLRLPTPLFRRIAKAMLTIDKYARSSMQDDLRLGRSTEIDALQGEVLKLAAQYGLDCPTIARIVAAIRAAEAARAGSPGLDPATLQG